MSPTVRLIIGDLIVIFIFSALGRAEHGMDLNLSRTAATAFPFAVAWLVVAPLLGGYRPDAYAAPGAAAKRAVLLVAVAVPAGLILRALMLSRPIPWTFAAITITTNLVLFTLWRAIFAGLQRRRAG